MFRDSEGRVLLQFSKEVSVGLDVHVEVLALREGLLVAEVSRWALMHLFMFKSDCQLVVAWVADPMSVSWHFHLIFRECCLIFGIGINWSMSHISRSGNEIAEILARSGSSGVIEFTCVMSFKLIFIFGLCILLNKYLIILLLKK